MDKEYAIYMNLPRYGGVQEIGTGATTLVSAKKIAREFIRTDHAQGVVIKYYEEGDLRHQWDWKPDTKNWLQYE